MHADRPSDLAACYAYMRDFEMALVTDDWSLAGRHFHEDAVHRIDGGAAPIGVGGRGREAIVAGLRGGVDAIDRRFDLRLPEILEGPELRPDGVWMRFALRLRREGAGELRIEGEHLAKFRDGRIEGLHEKVADGEAARVQAWLSRHEASLLPPGSAWTPPASSAEVEELEATTARSLVRCYGAAKSRADVEAALAVCSPGFTIETVAFGLRSRDAADTAVQLGAFFAAFPDYSVSLDGFASGPGVVMCHGHATMTFTGDLLDLRATGRRARLPIFCVFTMDGLSLGSERFFFDLASLCAQIGVPVDAMQSRLGTLRAAIEVTA